MNRERAKLSYRWQAAVIERWATSGGRLVRDEETGEPFRVPCCPDCTAQIVDKDGVPLTDEDLNRRKRVCAHCRSPLWQADKSGPKRYPLSDYVKHRVKGFFDLLVGDEIHEYKRRGAAHGIAVGVLADACGKSLTLTGTLTGGYSSTLFHLLYRFSPEIRPSSVARRMGGGSSGTASRRSPSASPTTTRWRTDATAAAATTARWSGRGRASCPRRCSTSSATPSSSDWQTLPRACRTTRSRSSCPRWTRRRTRRGTPSAAPTTPCSRKLRKELAEALKSGSKRLLATYLQTLLAYPEGCTKGETVFDPRSGDVIVQVPPLSEEKLYPKEQALVDLVAAERMEGRRVLVYVTHTGTRDITGRMEDILTRHGFRVAVMKAEAVAPNRREAWVADKVKEGIDVLICHPRLVQTGLDLIDFQTLCLYETDYSVYVMRQASRRSWRIGQTRPAKVVFMSYRNTLQADELKLVAKKLQSSLAVEGELPEDGLAAYGDDGDDLMMAIARKIVGGDEDEAETVEDVFAQARDAEATAEELLVDEGWKTFGVALEVFGANRNGANEIEPRIEVLVGGNGHYAGEPDEGQRSLFSWTGFMAEEPVKTSRGRKPKHASASLFEWAFSLEREREAEPVSMSA